IARNGAAETFRVLGHARRELQTRHESSGLFADFDAAPKSDVALDRIGGFLGLGIVPGGVLIRLLTDLNVVITCQPFPRAGRVGIARSEEFFFDRVGGKIMIALDDDGAIGFRQNRILPRGFHAHVLHRSCLVISRRSETWRTHKDNGPDTSCGNWVGPDRPRWPKTRLSARSACRQKNPRSIPDNGSYT